LQALYNYISTMGEITEMCPTAAQMELRT